MKRLLSILLTVVLLVGAGAISTGAIAPYLDLGRSYTVSGTVKTSTNSYSTTATAYPEQASGMFQEINRERKDAGLPELVRDTALNEAILERALEISLDGIKYFSHTRPDGTKWSTVSSLAKGENIAINMEDYIDTNNGFMNSKTHRENILDPDFTSVQVFCVERGDELYWIQLFGQATTTDAKKTNPSTPTATIPVTTGVLDEKTLVDEMKKAEAASGVKTVTVTNASAVSPATLSALKTAAGSSAANLRADTRTKNGVFVGRMTVNPTTVTTKDNIALGIEIDNQYTKATEAFFAKWFKNDIQIVGVTHSGSFGGTVRVTAKLTLQNYDKDNLVFYIYDRATNKYSRLENPDYFIDSNGFIHFTIDRGGDVVISNGVLA